METMNYEEAMRYLTGLTKFGFNFGLGRIEELLRRLGNPQDKMEYIHIGGTNGKGSVTVMVTSMMADAGLRPAVFTSPHLHTYRERMKINGEMVSEEDIATCLTELRPHIDAMVAEGFEHPTEFEVNTALALYYFNKKGVKNVVLEVGLGGEIDSTNVIKKCKIAVLTNIALEHMDYLGHTLEEICEVKSGIIKEHCTVITSIHQPAQLEQVKRKMVIRKAKKLLVNHEDFEAVAVGMKDGKQIINYSKGKVKINDIVLPLMGAHQVENAGVAISIALELGIKEEFIKSGIARTVWACRLETVSETPHILLDAAHNDHGMAVLSSYIKETFPNKKKILLIGMLADKEREKAVAMIGPLVDKVVITKPNSPRAGAFDEVANFFKPYTAEITIVPEIADAVYKAKELLSDMGEDAMLIITGSIYMVADARATLLNIPIESWD